MKKFSLNLKEILFDDKVNSLLVALILVFYATGFLIWHNFLRFEEIFIFSTSGIYPVRYLSIILPINFFLGIFSYKKEREISYLLFGASLFIATLLCVLEIYYLINLNNV